MTTRTPQETEDYNSVLRALAAVPVVRTGVEKGAERLPLMFTERCRVAEIVAPLITATREGNPSTQEAGTE